MFQSRYRAAFHFRNSRGPGTGRRGLSFNLVIERLFISGEKPLSLSGNIHSCFNLVIERLFISGVIGGEFAEACLLVSISLSSGFSFQARHLGLRRKGLKVSISLSSGFSFQGDTFDVKDFATAMFQSRYRAAFHFRLQKRFSLTRARRNRFNLVIERLFISGTCLFFNHR